MINYELGYYIYIIWILFDIIVKGRANQQKLKLNLTVLFKIIINKISY